MSVLVLLIVMMVVRLILGDYQRLRIDCMERGQILSNWECAPKPIDMGGELQ
jgi:hypothetical protein